MNPRRGFFRLWLVLSLIWVASVGFGLFFWASPSGLAAIDTLWTFRSFVESDSPATSRFAGLPEPPPPHSYADSLLGGREPPPPGFRYLPEPPPGFKIIVNLGMIEVRTPDGVVLSFPFETPREVIDKVIKKYVIERAWNTIGKIALATSLPPALILGIGLMAFWVLRGFKS